MEYNDVSSFERLTGLAFFTPADDPNGAISLGNIEMLKVEYGVKSIDAKTSVRGRVQLRQRTYTEALPVYSIDGNQFASPTIPLLLLGQQIADYLQTAATGSTFTFTAASGRCFFVGAYNITNVVVKVGTTTMTLGTDYFLDDPNLPQINSSLQGVVILPVEPQGINDGLVVTVNYNRPDLAMDQYQAFTNLFRQGTLVVFAEASNSASPGQEIWTMSVQLSCKKGADIDPSKFRTFTLEAAIFGNPRVLKPSESSLAEELLHLGVGGDTFAWQ